MPELRFILDFVSPQKYYFDINVWLFFFFFYLSLTFMWMNHTLGPWSFEYSASVFHTFNGNIDLS